MTTSIIRSDSDEKAVKLVPLGTMRPDGGEPGVQPVPMRLPFRVLAWMVAPLVFLGGGAGIWETVRCLLAGQWNEALQAFAVALVMTGSAAVLGRTVVRAAVTGLDPYSEDRARADAEYRAMLAALRATGEEHPELPRRPRG